MERYLDVYTVRRRRLQELIAEYDRETGTGVTEVARRIGRSPSHVSRMASENIRKPMGPAIARLIESRCGKPRGWMDTLDELAAYTGLLEHILAAIPPEAWNPLTRKLAVRVAQIALKEGWTGPTLDDKVQEYLRLVG